jgi:NAD dependent epimerase/dehydratase family enzyme
MLLPFRLGVGGVVGSGQQYWSWIGLDDLVAALGRLIESDQFVGPVNVVAPEPVTNREFTKTLGKVLHRPTLLPMPAFAARLAFGEMADELLLASTRVHPGKLLAQRFAYSQAELEATLRGML